MMFEWCISIIHHLSKLYPLCVQFKLTTSICTSLSLILSFSHAVPHPFSPFSLSPTLSFSLPRHFWCGFLILGVIFWRLFGSGRNSHLASSENRQFWSNRNRQQPRIVYQIFTVWAFRRNPEPSLYWFAGQRFPTSSPGNSRP